MVKKLTAIVVCLLLLMSFIPSEIFSMVLPAEAETAESEGKLYYFNSFDENHDGITVQDKGTYSELNTELTDGTFRTQMSYTGTSTGERSIYYKAKHVNTSADRRPLVLEYKVRFDNYTKDAEYLGGYNSKDYTPAAMIRPKAKDVYFSTVDTTKHKFDSNISMSDWHTASVVYSVTENTRDFYLDGKYIATSADLTAHNPNTWDEGEFKGIRFYIYGKNNFVTQFDYMKIYEAPTSFTSEIKTVSSEGVILSFNNIPVEITKDNFTFVEGATVKSVTKADDSTYIITPETPLTQGKSYTLSVNGIKDSLGRSLSNGNITFTPKKEKPGLTANQPEIIQSGAAKDDLETMALPVTGKAEVYNYGENPDTARLYLGCYNIDENGTEILDKYTYKDITVEPFQKAIVTTDELIINDSVVVKAFIWNKDNLFPLADFKEARFVYKSSLNGIPEFYATENLGPVSYAKSLCRSTTGLTKLGYRTYMTLIGNPAYIYEFDTLTGEFINRIAAGSGQHLALCVGSDGNLYHVPASSSTLYKYDPVTKQNTKIEKFYNTNESHWLINPGDDGNRDKLYISSQPFDDTGIPCVEFDVISQTLTIHTGFHATARYSHSASGSDEYIFVKVGDANTNTTLIRRDRETGEEKSYVDAKKIDDYALRIVGDIAVIGVRAATKVIDIETMTVIREFENKSTHPGPQNISFSDPDNPDLIYYILPGSKGLGQYSISKNEVSENVRFSRVYDQIGFLDFGTWVKKKDGTDAIVAVGGNDCEYGIYLITPGNPVVEKIVPEELEGGYGVETAPCFYYVTEDDVLYVGGYESGMNAFDLKTNKQIFSADNDIQYSMFMVGDKLFGGTYSSGHIYMVDTESANPYPTRVMKGANNICRFYDAYETNAGFGIFAGAIYYGGTSGGLYLCTYKDNKPQFKFYGNVIPGENISSVTYKDGYIYASSCNQLPNGTTENSHVAKIDAKTGETLKCVTVNIPEIGDVHRVIGCIEFGPDGLLYGLLPDYSVIFALNPDTLEIVKYHRLNANYNKETNRLYAARLYFGADGIIYTTIMGKAHAVNPENWEYTVLHDDCSYMGMDNDGNILMPSGSSGFGNSLSRIRVNQRQRLEQMIKTSEKYYVPHKDNYSSESYAEFEEALNKAKALDLSQASDDAVHKAARALTFGIKHLTTAYDAAQSFAYPFN